jgi:hypothetical protein
MYELYNSEQRLLLALLESVPGNDGGRRMSHHQTIYIVDGNGDPHPVGYRRITNDGEIISVWFSQQQVLFKPEAASQ